MLKRPALNFIVRGRETRCFVAVRDFVAVDKRGAINDPDGLEKVHPNLEKDVEARLANFWVIRTQPDKDSDQTGQSMHTLDRTVHAKPDIQLSDALD